MKIHQEISTISSTCIVFVVLLVLILSFPWTLIGLGGLLSKNPPQPTIKYGEFPFKLVYEINEKQAEITGTLVIKHLGVKYNEGQGKYNAWNTYYKDLKTNSNLPASNIPTSKNPTTDEFLVLFDDYIEEVGHVRIVYELGSCEYYMGLPEVDPFYKYNEINPGDIIITSTDEPKALTEEELYNRFNIKIIEKSISPPISQKKEDG